jgi:glycosyltransferase involved in cell wall biosynthesis
VTGPIPELRNKRVLLVHHWLYTWAGAERCLEQIAAMIPHADILAGIITPAMRRAHPLAARARESWVGRVPGARVRHRWFLPMHALAFAGYDTREYDLIISISHAFEKSIRATKPGARHLCYCLTPPRYLWEHNQTRSAVTTPVQRVALEMARSTLRAVDRRAASGVDRFVGISRFVAQRIHDCYGRDSAVVYPPVEMRAVEGTPARERFLLSLGRLVPYKRVDLAIAAAESLGLNLVVAGEGPERDRLQRMAGPHTTFLGAVSEPEAARLLSSCAAFVFCAEDDFGIAPVEANAHGAPVVAFGRGGAAETIIDGRSGMLFDEQTATAVAGAMERCLATSWDPTVLRENADRFSPERFRAGITAEIASVLS